MKWFPVLFLLMWICAIYIAGIYLFVGGFLLVRLEVNRTSSCLDALYPGREPERDFCRGQPRFHKAVLLIIDALKIDFARFDPNNTSPRAYENKLPVLEETVAAKPSHSRLYPFRADPPTTTMQRIKGFTTGSLPTFIDVGNNFASSAILEDNLIQQLGQVGKRVVFMGDDTWENLYPKRFHRSLPFPSFNVKDLHTVDDGILHNIYTTLEGDDWDVLVAHFLGVDHCGHRFGPDHPAMADKLTQMDGVIRSVMGRLQNDTLLVVMGDHGMTDTGDHGGESQKETDAAIFIYSPSPLFQQPQAQVLEPEVVPQTDLVPTLALLLGIPIPYSSVGQVLLPLFPPHGQSAVGALSQQEALWINAKQVNRFLETYSSMAKDIPPETLAQLRNQFSNLSSEYLTAHVKGLLSSPRLTASLQAYLTSVRDACRATWAKFNPLKMAAGLVILGLACAACFLVSELSLALIRENGTLKSPCVSAALTGSCAAVFQLLKWSYVEVSWCVACAALGSELSFLWKAHQSRDVGKTGTGWMSLPQLLTPAVFILLLRCASLLSDSYVIAEGRVVTFLLFSLALYIPVHLNWNGYLLPPSHDLQKTSPLLPSPHALSPSTVRKEASTLMACLGLVIGSLSLSLYFHGCREEQGACQPSQFLSPLSRMQDDKLRNFHYVLSILALALYTYLLKSWMRNYGNLNASSVTVFSANWILPVSSICLGLHWAVSGTPEDSFKNLSELIGLAQLALPRAAYCLLTLGLSLIWLDPLTVFVKAKTSTQNKMAPRLPPRYRASIGISPQAELHHLIPQIYQQMRQSLDDGEASGAGEDDGRPAVEAYGLGTVYSAPLLLCCGMMGVGLLLLHPEGMALAFLLLLFEMGGVLYIHASASTLSGQYRTQAGFNVPWTPVLLWALIAAQFFHTTGHLPTFPSIQWSAAFVGFPDGHTGTILPAFLVTLNTFASHILLAVSCPLLLFWPVLCEFRNGRGGKACGDEGEDAVMEIRLRESPQHFSSALLQLSARYLFIQGAQMFSSVCAAAILRRHLMVWKVFAPKLMFETSSFIATSVSVLFGVTLVLRIDFSVTRWFKRLVPEASR
uniref:GPI ethanolamine phosphate transferase 3, catalytic subunit n=1 Tax=Neogobius melanostomus TaxID=47308 RepID=A0A8C6WYD8_9GOBI